LLRDLLHDEHVQLLLRSRSDQFHLERLVLVGWDMVVHPNLHQILIVGGASVVLHIWADVAFILEHLLLGLLADDAQRCHLVDSLIVDVVFEGIDPGPQRYQLENLFVQLRLERH
jgi:hypothetical protein